MITRAFAAAIHLDPASGGRVDQGGNGIADFCGLREIHDKYACIHRLLQKLIPIPDKDDIAVGDIGVIQRFEDHLEELGPRHIT